MSANANIVNLAKGTSSLVRPRFSPGLLLRDDDLTTGVDYTRDLSRLLFRSLFGCGVVCGLEVTVDEKCGKLRVIVASGVALNGMGDPVHVPRETEILVDPTCGKEIPPKVWVILCRTEKCCAPRTTVCGCDEEDSASVCTREQEGFEIRLVQSVQERCACLCKEEVLPPPPAPRSADGNGQSGREEVHDCWCADPCDPCYRTHYDGDCGCECCDPNCVVLAVLVNVAGDKEYAKSDAGQKAAKAGNPWVANHSVRRFVRPVLMRDPIVYREQNPGKTLCGDKPSDYRQSPKVREETGGIEQAPPPPPAPPPAPPAAGPASRAAAVGKAKTAASPKAAGAAKQPKQK